MSAAVPVPFATTVHVRDTCLCLHTQRAARVLARRFDEALRPFGLTNGQFSLLNALNRPRPASMAQVASLLGADRTTLTRSIDSLITDGLVAREASARDRRIVVIKLTDAGRVLLERIRGEIRPLNQEVCAQLTTEEQAAMTRYLQKMLGGLIVEPDWKHDVIAFSAPAPPETA